MIKIGKRQVIQLFLIIMAFLGSFIYEKIIVKDNIKEKEQLKEDLPSKQTISLSENSQLKIYFIDVGQADCILVNNNGEYALIDSGNNEDGKKIVEYLNSLGVVSFKYVVATHAHEDHIGGMDDVINSFSIEHFFMPDVVATTKTFEDVLDALESKKIALEIPQVGETMSLADAKFEVLYVGSSDDDLNASSIVLKMYYGNTSYLFMGDATSKVEKKILDKNLQSDVLKVGHHGSQYSSTRKFLQKVSPKYAVIQVGKNNSYGHPKKAALKRLQALNVKVYRTDLDGTIILSSDGKKINFETIKTDTNG